MFVFDNIVFLSTLNRLIVAFEMLPNGTVKQLDLPMNQFTRFLTLKGGGAEKAYLYNSYKNSLIIYDRKERSFSQHTISLDFEKYYEPFLSESGDLMLWLSVKAQEPLEIYEFQCPTAQL